MVVAERGANGAAAGAMAESVSASVNSGAARGNDGGGGAEAGLDYSYMQRVKVYKLNDGGMWDDKGTGHVSVEYMEQSDAAGLVVISEEDTSTLLIHRISRDDIYQVRFNDAPRMASLAAFAGHSRFTRSSGDVDLLPACGAPCASGVRRTWRIRGSADTTQALPAAAAVRARAGRWATGQDFPHKRAGGGSAGLSGVGAVVWRDADGCMG